MKKILLMLVFILPCYTFCDTTYNTFSMGDGTSYTIKSKTSGNTTTHSILSQDEYYQDRASESIKEFAVEHPILSLIAGCLYIFMSESSK